MFRNSIHIYFRPHVLVTLLIAIVSIPLVFGEKIVEVYLSETISSATGIVAFFRHASDYLPKIGDQIAKAKEEVWLTGVSFYVTVPNNKDLILDRLGNGVNFKFLVLNPRSPNLSKVAERFSQTDSELRSECEQTVSALAAIKERWQSDRLIGKLEIRLLDEAPNLRIYIFDKRLVSGYTFFVPHVDHKNSPNLPGFLVKNISSGVAAAYFEGVEHLWSGAKEL